MVTSSTVPILLELYPSTSLLILDLQLLLNSLQPLLIISLHLFQPRIQIILEIIFYSSIRICIKVFVLLILVFIFKINVCLGSFSFHEGGVHAFGTWLVEINFVSVTVTIVSPFLHLVGEFLSWLCSGAQSGASLFATGTFSDSYLGWGWCYVVNIGFASWLESTQPFFSTFLFLSHDLFNLLDFILNTIDLRHSFPLGLCFHSFFRTNPYIPLLISQLTLPLSSFFFSLFRSINLI